MANPSNSTHLKVLPQANNNTNLLPQLPPQGVKLLLPMWNDTRVLFDCYGRQGSLLWLVCLQGSLGWTKARNILQHSDTAECHPSPVSHLHDRNLQDV